MSSKLISVFLVSIVSAFTVYILLFISPRNIVESDYVSFVTGAAIVKRGEGQKLYDLNTQQKYQKEIIGELHKNIFLPFRNLPFVALLFIPLTFFSLITGYKIFAIFNLLLLLFVVYSLAAYKNIAKNKVLFSLITALMFSGNILAIFYGQLSIVILSTFVCVFLFIDRKKANIAGLAFSLILLKPQYLLAFPFVFLLIKKKILFLQNFLISALLILSVSLLITDWHFLEAYKNLIIQTENFSYGTRVGEMYSLTSALSFMSQKNGIILALIGYLSSIFYFFKNFKKNALENNLAFLTIATLSFSPHALGSDLALLTFPIIVLAQPKSFLLISMLFLLPLTAIFVGTNLVIINASVLLLCFLIYARKYSH